MKHLTILVLIFSININSQTQSEFQKFIQQNNFKTYQTYFLPGGVLNLGTSFNDMDRGFCLVSDSGTINWFKFFSPTARIVNSFLFAKTSEEFYHLKAEDRFSLSLSKTNNLSFVWSNKYLLDATVADSNYDWGFSKFGQLANGDFFFAGVADIPIFNGWGIALSPIICLLDSTGNLLWYKIYKLGNHNFAPVDIKENSFGDLIIIGNHSRNDAIGLTTINGIATFLLSRTSGNIIGNGRINSYIDSNSDFLLGDFDHTNNTIVVSSLNLAGVNTNSSFLFRVNDDATFSWAKRFDSTNPDNGVLLRVSTTTGNETVIAGGFAITDTTDITTTVHPFCLKTDALAANVLWAKRYGTTSLEGDVSRLKMVSDNSLLLAGYFDNKTAYFWKINNITGNAACNSNDEEIAITDYVFSDSLLPINILHNNFLLDGSVFSVTNDEQTSNPAPKIIEVCSVTGIEDNPPILPLDISLSVYPNPFNPTTKISFSLPKSSNVNLSVYNLIGEKIKDLINGTIDAGYHFVDFAGSGLASGTYFCRLEVDNKQENIIKLILLK